MNSKKYLTSDFDYYLPKSFIANSPLSPRDTSKLLVYDSANDVVQHKHFYDIVDLLGAKDLIVRNKSKVIAARIIFQMNGAEKEIFLLRQLSSFRYHVLVEPGKSFKKGRQIPLTKGLTCLVEEILDDGSRIVRFDNETNNSLSDMLDSIGKTPLPPYIENKNLDLSHYQTVYADKKGSVAAPTAGLHFTKSLTDKLINKGVKVEEVVLHVGRGTFSPILTDTIEDHKIHTENLILSNENAEHLNKCKKENRKFTAVGTTSVRVLESCYDPVKGFLPYEGETDIFIYPGQYQWKIVDKLITNFHLPKSTLIMLVASFLEYKGVEEPAKKILSLYEIAKKENYRFYSLGDAMFIF